MKWRFKLFTLLLIAIFMLNTVTAAFAGDFINMSVNSTSFVPGEQGRYTLSFKLDNPIDISVGAYVHVYFPQDFSIVQNPIDSEDPGCALASIQYMLPGDKYYSIIQANDKTDPDQANRVTVKEDNGNTLFGFEIRNGSNINIAEETDIHLIIPGVINKPYAGNGTVTLAVYSADGQQYADSSDIILGDPPMGIPGDLSVTAAGSSTVEASWNTVEGASRYQLFYSSEPDGCYIKACDFGKEPAPGQDWSLKDTSVSYSGIGNGGLQPGKCYYFKMRAGNEFGYGQLSDYVEVEMPSVKLVESTPADNTKKVSVDSMISATLNTPLLIADDEKIQIYEASSGTPVVKNNVEALGDTLKIDAKLDYGKEYVVVLYEHAVESIDNNNVYNGLVGWSFTTRSKSGGGGGGGGGGSSSGSANVSSNATTPLPDSVIAEAINKAAHTQKVILNVTGANGQLGITPGQLKSIIAAGCSMEVMNSDSKVSITVNPEIMLQLSNDKISSFTIAARNVSNGGSYNHGSFRLAGEVYELHITATLDDGTVLPFDTFSNAINVAMPVPEEAATAAVKGNIGAAYYDPVTGEWIMINGGQYDAVNNTFAFQTEHLSTWALVYKNDQVERETVTFSDINGHWAQKEIEQLANKGYIKGVGANMFAPERMVTRAEFTAMLINIVGAEKADLCPFKDIPEKSWYRDSVSMAYASGLVKGISSDRFDPYGYVTREQVAVMAVNALQNKKGPLTANTSALGSYKDISSISSWAMEPCALAVEKGIIMGDNGCMLPGENTTRAQAAVILFKLLELMN